AGEVGGAIGGAAGGGLFGALGGRAGGRRGGARGAKWGSRFWKLDRHIETFEADVAPAQVLATADSVLAAAGRRVDAPQDLLDHPESWAIVPCGAANLNRAVVRVAAEPRAAGPLAAGAGATVTVTGASAEGLIKQHGARKAVERVRGALVDALRPASNGGG
ncbi:MAG TPA: hypothetical protein VKV06_01770, partial [Acidimicrobiales bacterium]|nr:hypothetical protein [Acidimicrobiales bacterium]